MLVIIGASGSGKTEIARILENEYGFTKVVTCTTRPKRSEEKEGVDYHFLTEMEFKHKSANNEFLETTIYNNYYYGTLYSDIKSNSILVLNPDGANALYKTFKDQLKVYYLTTSVDIRRERMIHRGDNIRDINYRIINDNNLFDSQRIIHIDYILDSSIKPSIELAKEIYNHYIEE